MGILLHQIGRQEIERLRNEGELHKAKAKDLFQRADALEVELGQLPASDDSKVNQPIQIRHRRSFGVADQIVKLLDANVDRAFNPETMTKELGQRVDPSLVSRLKKETRIAKARTGGYCSVHASDNLKEALGTQSLNYTDGVENTMTQ